jgi:hypothetical protein
MHPPVEVGESLCKMWEACIHASEGAQVLHDHVGIIDFFKKFECIFRVLHQLVIPGRGSLSTETPPGAPGASGSLHFFYHIL